MEQTDIIRSNTFYPQLEYVESAQMSIPIHKLSDMLQHQDTISTVEDTKSR